MKNRLIIIGGLLLFAVGYVAVSSYLNSTGFRRSLLKQINAAIDGQFSFEHHRVGLLSSQLKLNGVLLLDHRGKALAAADHIALTFSWPALLWRQFRIKSLSFDKTVLNLRFDHQDRLQMISFKPTNAAAPAKEQRQKNKQWSLRIDNAQLIRGELYYVRPSKGWSARAGGLKVAAGIDLQQRSGHIQIDTGPLQWQQAETIHHLASLKITASMDAAQLMTLKVQVPHAKLSVSGRPGLFAADPALDLTANLDITLDSLHTWFPEATSVKGRLGAQLTAKGVLKEPAVRLHAQWTNGEVLRVPFKQISADLELNKDRVAIRKINSQSPWGALDLVGTVDLPPDLVRSLNPAQAHWTNLAYDLKLTASDLHPSQLASIDYLPKGTFQLITKVKGSGLAGPQAQGQADIDINATSFSLHPDSKSASGHLAADLRWKGAELEVNALDAILEKNSLKASAQLNTTMGIIKQAQAHLKTDNIEALGDLLGLKLPSGRGEVKLQGQGPFRSPTAHVELLAEQLAINQQPMGRLLVEASLNEKGAVSIPRMILENQGSQVQGTGEVMVRRTDGRWSTDPGVRLDLALQQLALSDFGILPSMGGHLNGRVQLGGTLNHLSGEIMLAKSPLSWGGLSSYVNGHGRWEDGRLVIQDLNLFNKGSSVHLKGAASWRQPGNNQWSASPHVQAEMNGQDVLLQDFFQGYQGKLAFRGNITGAGKDLMGRFQASGDTLTIDHQPFQYVALRGRLAGNRIVCEKLRIDVQNKQTIEAHGWYDLDRQFQLHLNATDISLSHITALQQTYPVNGDLNLQMDASGSLDHPRMNAKANLRQPRLKDQSFDDFAIRAELANQKLAVSADLNFDVEAEYHMDRGDFDLHAYFDHTDLSPYLAIWVGPDWDGQLSGLVQASGNRHRPLQIEGILQVDKAVLRHRQQPLITASQLSARLKNQRLELPTSRLGLPEQGYIHLSAQGNLPAQLAVTADGRMPVSALAPFFSSLENSNGELHFQTRTQGALADLQWEADLDLKDVGFDLPGLGQPVDGLNGRLNLSSQKLTVRNLNGHAGQGQFQLDGTMRLSNWRPIDGALKLEALALPLEWPGTMDGIVNADLTLEGSELAPQLNGRLVLLEGSYYKDVRLNLLSTITQPRRSGPSPPAVQMPTSIGAIAIDVDLVHRYPLLVDNNLANLQVAPDLKIGGTLARPIVSGRAEVVEGEVIFRGKTFTIQRGVVDFINPFKIEPNLDIMAQADIRQWQVSLNLSGTPEELLFDLTSSPEATQSDILSLILLGRTSEEIGEGEGGQTTQQMLAALLGMAWGEEIRERAGLDILEVATGQEDDSQSADRTQLTVGKRLSRRLTIKYEVESGGDEVVQRAVSEYRFLEHLLASGFQNSRGEYGTELLFRLEF